MASAKSSGGKRATSVLACTSCAVRVTQPIASARKVGAYKRMIVTKPWERGATTYNMNAYKAVRHAALASRRYAAQGRRQPVPATTRGELHQAYAASTKH